MLGRAKIYSTEGNEAGNNYTLAKHIEFLQKENLKKRAPEYKAAIQYLRQGRLGI